VRRCNPTWIVLAAALLPACTGETGQLPPGPVGFRVALVGGDPGRPDARLPFSLEGATYTLDIEALPAEAFREGWVAIRVQPGDVLAVDAPGAIRSNIQLHGGRATGVQVTVVKVYGDARLWVEDLGFVPGPAAGSACGNGVDDDGDGLTDFGSDPGCAYSNDDAESEGSHAVGLSPLLYYQNPRVADVQGLTSVPPLEGRSINIDAGDIIVTRVSVDGLYVSDVSETRGYNHLFAFNFNTPAGVRVCDKLLTLGGIVGEFYGYTELTYPSWTRDPTWARPERPSPAECPVPEPMEITGRLLDDAAAMESLEAGLIQVSGGRITPRFEDCDFNDNDDIDWDTPEEECADDCDAALDCSELTQYRTYGQFSLSTPGATAAERGKIQVLMREAVPDFDALAHAGETVALIRGTLSQVEFLDVPWILEVRCRDDLVLSGAVKPMHEACVGPVPDDEDYSR
jgi:hypothetical protein